LLFTDPWLGLRARSNFNAQEARQLAERDWQRDMSLDSQAPPAAEVAGADDSVGLETKGDSKAGDGPVASGGSTVDSSAAGAAAAPAASAAPTASDPAAAARPASASAASAASEADIAGGDPSVTTPAAVLRPSGSSVLERMGVKTQGLSFKGFARGLFELVDLW
jgi:hypothetical protein